MSSYDPNQFPPDLSIVDKHYKANQVGTLKNLDDFCPCCSKPVNKEKLSIWSKVNSLGFLGPLFPQYFNYMKYSITLILLMFLPSIYSVFYNISGNVCTEYMYSECGNSDVAKSSYINVANLNK